MIKSFLANRVFTYSFQYIMVGIPYFYFSLLLEQGVLIYQAFKSPKNTMSFGSSNFLLRIKSVCIIPGNVFADVAK